MASAHPLGTLTGWVGFGDGTNGGTGANGSQTFAFTPNQSAAPAEVKHEYVKAEDLHLLGVVYPVDPYGAGAAPKLYTMTWNYKFIDRTTTSAAYANNRAGYNTLMNIFDSVDSAGNSGQKGTLTAHLDINSSATVSCTARFMGTTMKIGPEHVKFLELPMQFVIYSDWA